MFGGRKAERDAAFTEFMTGAGPSLTRTAWLLTGDADAARDLVQGALVKTYAAWHRVADETALAYTRRVLINLHHDGWRRTGGHELVSDTLPDRGIRAEVGQIDDRDTLARALAQLPPQQRTVVVLRYYNDLSEQAVADLLGVSTGTVKSAASRGLAALRTQFMTTEGGPR